LNPGINFKSYDLKNVYGSIVITPWSSKILFANSDISKLPVINIFGGPLDFGRIEEGESSVSKWYTVNVENLTEPLIITSPEGFEISTDVDGVYSRSISLKYVNGISDEIIFVKFVPEDEKNYYGYISNKSGNVEMKIKIVGTSR
ncbi:MAG: hypothetical protein ABIY50_11635, partial [Ignavibacteria bacterium]